MGNKNFKFGNTAGWLNATRLRLLGNHGRVIDLFNDNGILSMRTDRGKIRQLMASQSSGYCDIVITTETDIETYLNNLDFNEHPEGTSLFVATDNYDKIYACISSGSFWYYEQIQIATNISISADDITCAKDESTVDLVLTLSNLDKKSKEWDLYIAEYVAGDFAEGWIVGSVVNVRADNKISLTLTVDKSKITFDASEESQDGYLRVRLPGVSISVTVTVYNDDYSFPSEWTVDSFDVDNGYYRVYLDSEYGDVQSIFSGASIRLNYNEGSTHDCSVTGTDFVGGKTMLITNADVFGMSEVYSIESIEIL